VTSAKRRATTTNPPSCTRPVVTSPLEGAEHGGKRAAEARGLQRTRHRGGSPAPARSRVHPARAGGELLPMLAGGHPFDPPQHPPTAPSVGRPAARIFDGVGAGQAKPPQGSRAPQCRRHVPPAQLALARASLAREPSAAVGRRWEPLRETPTTPSPSSSRGSRVLQRGAAERASSFSCHRCAGRARAATRPRSRASRPRRGLFPAPDPGGRSSRLASGPPCPPATTWALLREVVRACPSWSSTYSSRGPTPEEITGDADFRRRCRGSTKRPPSFLLRLTDGRVGARSVADDLASFPSRQSSKPVNDAGLPTDPQEGRLLGRRR